MMLSVNAVTSLSSCSAPTTRLTSPLASASSALMKAPVTSISNAALRDRLRDSATLGVEQNSPRLTPLTANFASREATAKSHIATNWQPAAVAIPCTRAITGTGRVWMRIIMRPHCSNKRW